MRIPPDYEKLIREIAEVAWKNKYSFECDTLTDNPPELPGRGHTFEICVHLKRSGNDFIEDAPVPI